MSKVNIDFNNVTGKIKPMHAVNNGPVKGRSSQTRSNFDSFKDLQIPYVRNHDASYCADYGGEHTVDVHAIFPDFTKNPHDPSSYDFTLTDEYTQTIVDAGSNVFYRLGSKIELWSKKYGTIVPADFHKWAVICEHIIMHYNEGWANGFHHNIEYWEIWNEPDGFQVATGTRPNWSGTDEQYCDFYKEVSIYLKRRFPNLKIGGPATANMYIQSFMDTFAKSLTTHKEYVPLDFYSYHIYTSNPYEMEESAQTIRKYLDDMGYTETELILNEWNYIEDWRENFVNSIKAIISMRGAAFVAACMSVAQKSHIDMFMYYDARVNATWNGMFDFYTLEPLKTYYVFKIFSELYMLGNEVESSSDDKDIFITAACNEAKKAVMVTYYSLDKEESSKKVEITGLPEGKWCCELLDKDNTMTCSNIMVVDGRAEIEILPETVIFLYKS